MVIEEGVKLLTTGAGSPAAYMEKWKAAGIKVIPVVASVAYALKMQELGATAVVAEGAESGGHVGDNHTMALVPQVIDALDIPSWLRAVSSTEEVQQQLSCSVLSASR